MPGLRLIVCLGCLFWAAGSLQAQLQNPANGSFYYVTEFISPSEAELFSNLTGADLVAVNDAAEQAWIETNLGASLSFFTSFWIGLSDEANEGVFVWSNGDPVTYTNWRLDQPDNGDGLEEQDFVRLEMSQAGQWNDVAVDDGARAIFEVAQPLLAPVTDLVCGASGFDLALSWTNPVSYSSLDLYRDGQLLATLPGSATSYLDTTVSLPGASYWVFAQQAASTSLPAMCGSLVTDPAYTLRVTSATTTPPAPVSVSIELDSQNPLDGWSFGVCHDATQLTVQLVEQGEALVNAVQGRPAFYSEQILADGFTVGVIVDFAIGDLPAGDDQELSKVTYGVVGAAPASVDIEFCGNLGVPAVSVVVVDQVAASRLPILEAGVIDILPRQFLRGDCNADATVNIADVVAMLNYLFAGAADPACFAACDSNSDNVVDLADPVFNLGFSFGPGPVPAPPYPLCDVDPTPTPAISCVSPLACP